MESIFHTVSFYMRIFWFDRVGKNKPISPLTHKLKYLPFYLFYELEFQFLRLN
eukprot:UN02647